MFLTGLNLTCSNLKTLRKMSNHGAINPIDHAHKLTRQFHVHAVFNTFHPRKHPLWTHKRIFSALNTVWHEIFERSNFGEFSRDPQRFFQRYNFKSAVKCSCPCSRHVQKRMTLKQTLSCSTLSHSCLYTWCWSLETAATTLFLRFVSLSIPKEIVHLQMTKPYFSRGKKNGWSRTSDSLRESSARGSLRSTIEITTRSNRMKFRLKKGCSGAISQNGAKLSRVRSPK